MTAYIEELLSSQTLWSRFSAAGRERTERYFNLKHQTAQLEAIYDEVVRDANEKRGSRA